MPGAKPAHKKASLPRMTGEGTRTFGKDGGDLLSRLRSTIGAVGLNFSVRNGKRWNTNAIATRMGDMTDNPDASEDPHREGIGHVSRYAPSQTPRRGRKGGKKLQDRSKAAYIFRQAPHGGAPASFGQLVRLGFDVTVFTPASYLRHRL